MLALSAAMVIKYPLAAIAVFLQTGIDAPLLSGAVAWASLAAARRVGSWLSPG
ncbi:MAG: hypothetical protein HGA19_21790 [Oscillochloris sp.]|nr:hypothetical protein [Oscillochloris sp.]